MSNFKYVDLGLSSGTLWANENLPGYYAFGELEEKLSYTQDNSITFDKNKIQLMKEGLCDSSGNVISKHSYTIPTKEQFLELMTECDWKWDSNNYGYRVRSKKYNDEDHEIFFPTEGYKLKTDVVDKGIWGNYWTASIIDGKYHGAYLYFFKNAIYWGNHSERFYGRSVRPVLNTKCSSLIDLNLPSKTLWDSKNFGANYPTEIGQIVAYGEPWGKDPELYDLHNWRYARYNEGLAEQGLDPWYYRPSDASFSTSMWDFVENASGEKTKCFSKVPYKDWIVNTTGLQEPSEKDYEELIDRITSIEDITYNGLPLKLVYFQDTIEVLVFSYGRTIKDYPSPGNTERYISQWYYWTKDLIEVRNTNLGNIHAQAKVFHIFNLEPLIEDMNVEQGIQIRRIKKQ